MPYEAQLLFRHNVEDEPDGLHMAKHLQSIRNGASGGKWAALNKSDNINEDITDYVGIGQEALEETGGGEQPIAWKPRL